MFFYEPLSATACVSVLLYLAFLIGMNELSRLNKWIGAVIFIALAGRSDRLRLAPYRGRGHGRRHLVPVGENLLVLSWSDSWAG